MKRVKPMLIFLGLTLAIFIGLILFGPNKLYADFYRGTGNLLYSKCGNQRIANFKAYVNPTDPHDPKDTLLRIGRVGKGYMAEMPINSKRLAYIPTAILIALMLATPIHWKQKLIGLAIGMVVLQVLIQMALGISLAEGFTMVTADERKLLKLPKAVDWIVGRLDQFLSGDMNVTFIMPVLVWLLVVSGMWDFRSLLPVNEDEFGGDK